MTPSFFRLIRVPPQQGRVFGEEEGQIGKHHAVILGGALWQRLFGGTDPIGHDVRIDGQPYTVVGVMPASFLFIDPHVQAWVPLTFTGEQKTQRYANNYGYIGRLKPGATLAQARTQLDALNATNLERYPETKSILASTGFHSVVTRLQDDLVRDMRSTLYLLWGGALFVLLIGCVNVANLVLVRSRVRLKEFATRMAIGAGRWRIVRQLVAEHVLLTTFSAVGGLAIGAAVLQGLDTVNLQDLPRGAEIRLDGPIVWYTLIVAALVGVVLGSLPAAGGLPTNLTTVLREEGRSSTGGRGVRLVRRALIVTQVAVAFVLLIGAGLLFTSFRRVLAVDPGLSPDKVLTVSVTLPPTRYADAASIRRFTDSALRAIRSAPSIVAAGATTMVPFGDDFSEDVILPEGYEMTPSDSLIAPFFSVVTPGYFETLHVRLVAGRYFDDRDTSDSQKTVIVDERLARRFWPGANPIGRRLYEPTDVKDLSAITDKTEFFTVIGVAGEVKLRGLVEGVGETGAYYMAQAQRPDRNLTFAVRAAGPPQAAAGAIRAEIGRIDRELPVFDVQTMDARMEKALAIRRSAVWLSVSFGAVALLLSAIGIYGVLAYLVTQRTKEIGIRIALGSSARAVFELVVREGLLLVGAGFVLGAAGAIALRRSLESQLFGVSATDPVVLMIVTATLALVAIAACALPARRATRINPIVALSE